LSNQFDEEDEQEEAEEAMRQKLTAADHLPEDNDNVAPTVNGKRVRARLPKHVIGDKDPNCPVCLLDPDRLDVVKTAFINGVSLQSIVTCLPGYNLKKLWIKAHAKRFYWDWEQSKVTDRTLILMQKRGMKYVRENPNSVDAETLLKVTQWIDRREGRIVDKQEQTTNVSVQFQSQPPKITPAKNALPEVTSGKKPLTLAPVSIEVLDAAPESAETVQATPDGANPETVSRE